MLQKYGLVNNIGEIKLIQLNSYKGEGFFVGITKNGFAYIYDGKETKKLTKEEIGQHLSLNQEQVLQLLRRREQFSFDASKERSHDITNAFESVSDEGTRVIEKDVSSTNAFKQLFSKQKQDINNKTAEGGHNVKNMDISVGREMSSGHAHQSTKVVTNNKASLGKQLIKNVIAQTQDSISDALSFEESNEDKKSLKKQVRDLTRKVQQLEDQMVTKEQMIKIIESLSKGV
jgi:hypothetical protein